MKMRKRIAALIAVAMIAALMPMTAFAASTNQLTKGIITVGKGNVISEKQAPGLEIKLKHAFTTDSVFYLELENAEWEKNEEVTDGWAGKAGAKVDLYRVDGKTLEVKSNGMNVGDVITIPLIVKATGGEASVTIDSYGTVVNSGKYIFAVSDDAKANVKTGDAKVIVDSGKLATITIEEPYVGAFEKEFGKKSEGTITLELEDKDFSFIKNTGKLVTKRIFDFSDISGVGEKQELKFTIKKADVTGEQKGIIEIKDVEINASRKAREGDVEVYVSGTFLDSETLVLAKYGDYATKLTTEKVEEWKSGTEKTLKFKLEEIGKGAIVKERSLDLIFPEDIKVTKTNKGSYKDNEVFIENFRFMGDDTSVEFEVEVEIPAKFTGDLTVIAEGRALEESKELLLAEIEAPVTVEVEPIKVELGQKSNKGGKITITEAEKGMIKRNTLVIQLPKDLKDDGAEFINVKDLDIETTGGIKVEKASLTTSSAIVLEVTRQSKEAGSIEISGFEVKARRTLADGAYEVEIGGKAISDVATATDIDPITTADFILVGDQLTKAVVQFVIGSDKFLVDGKEVTMDAAAYIKDGRTMVPLRYLSYAIGIDEQAIKFNAGIVTIIDGTRIIQLQNGSKNLLVNGMTIPMSAAAEIVDGRTYVPVAEIGAVFGVTGSWDSVTQTATFK